MLAIFHVSEIGLEAWSEGVTERNAYPCRHRRTELLVIFDQVQMGFWADKDVTVDVVTNAASKVTHEVIATNEVGTAEGPATGESLIEANALPSKSGLEFGGCVIAQFGSIDSVEVIKKRTRRGKTSVDIPAGPPSQLAAHAELIFQKNIGTESRISTAAQSDRIVVSSRARS